MLSHLIGQEAETRPADIPTTEVHRDTLLLKTPSSTVYNSRVYIGRTHELLQSGPSSPMTILSPTTSMPSSTLPPLPNPVQRFLHPNAPDPHKSKDIPHSSPVFSSPYGPFPSIPSNLNVHDFCFPANHALPPDYDLFVNAVSGEKVTLHEFYARVKALSRVLRWDGEGNRSARGLNLGRSPRGDWEEGEIMGRSRFSFSPGVPSSRRLVWQEVGT